jgi:lipoprotein-anchoring transpeptidase ErfK/SrfK
MGVLKDIPGCAMPRVGASNLCSWRRDRGRHPRMRIASACAVAIVCAAAALMSSAASGAPRALDAQAVNDAQLSAASGKKRARAPSPAAMIKAEILLDRAGFSPGQIDGKSGNNEKKALAAFQDANGIKPSGRLDAATWDRLTATSSEPALMEYEIEPADVKGPFNKTIPQSFEKKAELKNLNYTSPRELLAEKFHIAPALLTRLNPRASFETAGTKIVVPNVARKSPEAKVEKVVVDKSALTVRALDRNGKLISFYPASVGSTERPSPSGTRHIHSVVENPTYHYSPKLKFKGVKTQKPFDIAAGPMNPVGSTWIDLGDSYGIHGTPAPESVGKSVSHGCVHLTNWDAHALSKMVHKGTEVDFIN